MATNPEHEVVRNRAAVTSEQNGSLLPVERGVYTNTQYRMMEILSDGAPKTVAELMAAVDDDMAKEAQVKYHIFHLRKRLPTSKVILTTRDGSGETYYQLRRKLVSLDE